MENKEKSRGVFVIYTGGTIGSMPKDPNDPDSPQVVVPWEKYCDLTPQLDPNSDEYIGFRVDSYSTEPLDSCNIGPKEWKEMAEVIKKNYDDYEGFVILHGTDTMVYTASALSFMLQNLAKPVIITGAQLAYLFNPRNDGFQNMITSLMIANPVYSKIPIIPEVCIYFNGKLLRGNRSRKLHASGFDAYQTPNYPPLGIAGESIIIDKRLIRDIPQKAFSIKTRMETNVVAINFFPGIQDSNILQNILSDETLKGIVLMAYGAGNIPTKKEVMELIKSVTDKGIIALDVTQCGGGKVELGIYDTSSQLLDIGVVSGVDITPECALTKLMYLLGDEDMSLQEIALKVQHNLSGEQSISIHTTIYKIEGKISIKGNRKRIPAEDIRGIMETIEGKNDIDKIMLRFRNAQVLNLEDKPVVLKLFIDLGSDDELNEDGPNYMGSFTKAPTGSPSILFFDITEKAHQILSNRASFTISLQTENATFLWSSVELVLFVSEL